MLLTGAQVSMAITSGIVFLFTFLLFLSGYILQQQTVKGLQGAIRHHIAQQNEKLPVNFPKSTGIKIIPGPKETFFASAVPRDGAEEEGIEADGDSVMGHMLSSVDDLRDEEVIEIDQKRPGGRLDSEDRRDAPETVMDATGERWAVKNRGGAIGDDGETNSYRRRMAQMKDERRHSKAQKKMEMR